MLAALLALCLITAISLTQSNFGNFKLIATPSNANNAVKTAVAWREKMLKIELAVCQQSPYRDIAAFQHIWLQKGDENDSLLCK